MYFTNSITLQIILENEMGIFLRALIAYQFELYKHFQYI